MKHSADCSKGGACFAILIPSKARIFILENQMLKNVFCAAIAASVLSSAAFADVRDDAKWAIDQAAGQLPSEVVNALSVGSGCMIDRADEYDVGLLVAGSAAGGAFVLLKAAKQVARGNARGCLRDQGAEWVIDTLDAYDPTTQVMNGVAGAVGGLFGQ
ncbi:hypothetical protein [Donghicola mangrovi]|uniref:Uncharacterized protein n=1 Tax=Donghicola mangrovi TaxID=2729614 RepID=A0A850QD53_9RHOB|nr:hypothetical protein [Donghicola mangrovi]NVO24355.1 hypothetical protein [Donghicola mangrovi]